jgi:hypothetical protein
MQTTIQKIDNQRKLITYHTLEGIKSFARDKKLELYETGASFSVSIFDKKIRREVHVFYKPTKS